MGCWDITAFESGAGLDSVEYIRRNLPEDGRLELGNIIKALKTDDVRLPEIWNAESHSSPMALAEIIMKIVDRTDYAKNPDKTNDGELLSSYQYDSRTVQGEFMLSKWQYDDITGRTQASNVIAYQIRQAFKPGEITPELANKIGYELGMNFTKGNHAFIVATHIDKFHIHNHILFNSTSLDCTKKFRDFKRSGKHYAFKGAEQKKFVRLRSLGEGYSEDEIKAVIEGKTPQREVKKSSAKQPKRQEKSVNLLVDIQAKLQQGKGKGYEQWANAQTPGATAYSVPRSQTFSSNQYAPAHG